MPHSGVWRKMTRVSGVNRFHEANRSMGEFKPDEPHPEERAFLARVSKDGRWRDLVAVIRDAHRNRLLPISTS